MDDHTQEDFTGNNAAMNNFALPPGVNIDDDIVNIYVNPPYYRHQDHTSTNQLFPEDFAASFTELEPQYGGSSVGSGTGGSSARRRRTRRVPSEDHEQNYSQQRLYPGE
ncbi:hypothetical protein E2C01_012321 [Portunus trituberculatus]|uniref:Uncharacterized protein n=1 Tax=Portunus trituberculatus TaxID=210409 RepID=A0A5B7DDW1_PORTR|nr:hypothetical protein [Portunus trituberculatus]